jgi:hypothetical protein
MTCNGPEQTFADLIEHVADWTRDAPLLLLVMARPELLDARSGWGPRQANATTRAARAAARGQTPATSCTSSSGPRGSMTHMAARESSPAIAEGNPLFVEEIVAMLIDDASLGRAGVTGPAWTGPTRSPFRRRSRH